MTSARRNRMCFFCGELVVVAHEIDGPSLSGEFCSESCAMQYENAAADAAIEGPFLEDR